MAWRQLVTAAADSPVAESSGDSVTVALIAALGTVLVAVIGLFAQMVSRSRTSESAPPPSVDPRIGEKVAVTDARLHDTRSAVNIQDHRLDVLEDKIERIEWLLTRPDERRS